MYYTVNYNSSIRMLNRGQYYTSLQTRRCLHLRKDWLKEQRIWPLREVRFTYTLPNVRVGSNREEPWTIKIHGLIWNLTVENRIPIKMAMMVSKASCDSRSHICLGVNFYHSYQIPGSTPFSFHRTGQTLPLVFSKFKGNIFNSWLPILYPRGMKISSWEGWSG